jgi:ankyrin repeat protein
MEMRSLLIEHGVDVNERSDIGTTALDTACDEKQLEVIKLLLEHGATF